MSDADKIALVDQIDFESLTSLSYTFVDCDITSVVSQLEQANVTFITEFVSMFENAIIEGGSTSLDLSNWDIDDEANVNNMFAGAENLADDTCWWPPLKTDAYDWLPRTCECDNTCIVGYEAIFNEFHGAPPGAFDIDVPSTPGRRQRKEDFLTRSRKQEIVFLKCSDFNVLNDESKTALMRRIKIGDSPFLSFLFRKCNFTGIEGLQYLDVSNVKNFEEMFDDSTGVQNIESWDVSAGMFFRGMFSFLEGPTLVLDDWQTTINWQSDIDGIVYYTSAVQACWTTNSVKFPKLCGCEPEGCIETRDDAVNLVESANSAVDCNLFNAKTIAEKNSLIKRFHFETETDLSSLFYGCDIRGVRRCQA